LPSSNSDALDLDAEMVPEYIKALLNDVHLRALRSSRLLSSWPYWDRRFVCMKKTLHIDERLLRDARTAAGAKTDTDTVRLGLEALMRRAAYERLRTLRGAEPGAKGTPRRRERGASAKHSAA
jgi:hypothetical protein